MYKILDKKEYKKIQDNLEKLGLGGKEVSVYLDLLSRQTEVGSTKVVQGTQLHRQYVYNAIEALEQKGLVKHVIKNGRKKFSANPPHRLSSLVDEKRIIANDLVDALESIFQRPERQEFEVYQGREQFITHEFRLVKEAEQGSFVDILGGAGSKFSEMLGEERDSYNELSLERDIRIRFLGAEDQREYLAGTKRVRANFDFRIMKGLNNSYVSTSIRPNNITFQVYGNPTLAFYLKSKEIAQDYRNFFETLWNSCEVVE